MTSHPFYLGQSAGEELPNNPLKLRGNCNSSDGIVGDESFKVDFRKRHQKLLKAQGSLEYFCTDHPDMVGGIGIKSSNRLEDERRNDDAFQAFSSGIDEPMSNII